MAPNSPDLNPVDYAAWRTLQQSMYVYRTRFLAWMISKTERAPAGRMLTYIQIIDKSIDHRCDKLKAVVRLNGGHIKQLF